MKTFLTFHENAYGPSFGQMIPVADLQAKFTQRDVDDVEKFADRILKKYDIDIEFTRHFIDRLNDPRNNPEIKVAELQRFFKKIQKNKGQNIRSNPDVELVLKDMSSNLNLPVVINSNMLNISSLEIDFPSWTVFSEIFLTANNVFSNSIFKFSIISSFGILLLDLLL